MIFSIKIYRVRTPFFKTQPIFARFAQKINVFSTQNCSGFTFRFKSNIRNDGFEMPSFQRKSPAFARLFAIV